MGSPTLFCTKKKNIFLLSFFFPFFICLAVYAIGGYFPFGDRQIIVTDFWHQYYQVICELREKLLSGGSMLYSWHSGLGTNFIAMLAYYGASPFNLLTVFVPESGLRIAISLICLVKISLCSLSSAVCLSYVQKRNDASVVFFSSLFAFCAYIMGYYWNIMWLDSVAVFPIVFLGLYKLICERKALTYTVSLFLCLVFNYYIGFYCCIAVFFAAIFITVVRMDKFSFAVRSFFSVLFHSAAAVGASAFMLFPAFLSLQNTYSAANNTLRKTLFNGNVLDFLSALLPFQEPNSKDLDTPNLFCGVICVLLFFLYFFNKSFKIREKICSSLFLSLIFLCCLFKPADYVINGFHYTNMIPYRYTFVFSFILVFIAYRVFCTLERVKIKYVFISLALTFALCALACFRGFVTAGGISAACALIYALFITVYRRGVLGRRALACAVCLLISVEAAASCAIGISNYSVYSTYLDSYSDIKELLSRREDGGELCRTEISSYKTLNDPLLYGYNGVSQFSSAANYGVSSLLTNLGTGGYCSGNRYVFSQTTPLAMSALGIKYIISKDGNSSGDTTLIPAGMSGDCAMYEYKYRLPIAFITHGDTDKKLTSSDVFANQSLFFNNLTGVGGNLFSRCSDPALSASGATVTGGEGTYTFTCDTDEKCTLSFEFSCHRDGLYYVWAKIPDTGALKIDYQTGKTNRFSTKAAQSCILPAGYHRAGETFTVSCTVDADTSSRSARVYAAQMNEELFQKGYEKLTKEQMYGISYTDTSVTGTVNAERDGYLYTSIPYEEGWSVYIDGEKVKTEKFSGAFVTAEVKKGEHRIEMKYFPAGLKVGLVICAASVSAYAVCAIIYNAARGKRKRKNGKETVCN